jgi:hypothetical protein
MLLPSVAAAAIDASPNPGEESTGGFLAVQLIPYFTLMAKRLAAVQESVMNSRDSIGGSRPLIAGGVIGNIGGQWALNSSPTPCNTIGAQKYKLNIDYPFTPSGFKVGTPGVLPQGGATAPEGPGGKGVGGLSLPATRIAGSGRYSRASVTIAGTQLRTRLKFLEKWSSGSNTLVDVRLSLCGGFFSGIYTDMKSSKNGEIEGVRISLNVNSLGTVRNVILKSSLLCAMACGKLSSNLISMTSSPMLGLGLRVKDEGYQKKLSDVGEDEEDKEDREDSEEEGKTSNIALTKWLRSDLLSGNPNPNTSTYSIPCPIL